ncbi:Serine/threonine-protein kinase PknD [Pontiella desulfatans]|uniref:Serine/threonine-protein kinase PknD n=1 Tax=Pontiella desulfatans TaxID=2750659 RepID=A0A6C2U2D6_PONDE|nr:serine/threonine-protein kinase [Pontiella desulfatans]VGO14152.1 Serine/threonine-protein kinase PknD [Pontiella desulfatans]
MADGDSKDLERDFSERYETLASFYNTDALEMSADEVASLTPILNSLKDDIARYREIGKIAEGGEKKISLVHDHRLDRRVAMAHAVRNGSPQDLEQFLREARLTANLAHPNIMPVYNMGLDENGEPFFSMELIPGDSLKSIVRKLREGDAQYRETYSIETLLNIFLKICDAIAFAHSRKVLHLDIKPDNIRVGGFGEVLVCDWGLACVVNSPDGDPNAESFELDADVLNDMTLSGTMKGTPGFMAPEQTQAYGAKTPQTDIYSLGALLYVLLTHKLPVEGESANEVIRNTREGKVVPPRRRRPDRRIPLGLVAVMMKALALKPEDRYESVVALGQDISRFLSGHPTRAEHAGWITKTSLLLRRHNRMAFLLIFFLLVLAFVVTGNLASVSREKAEAIAARKKAEENFELYRKELRTTQALGAGLGEAMLFTVRSRDFVNAPSMIHLLETGLAENIDTVKRQNLYEQKGILHFVLEEFNAANESFDAAGNTKRIGQLRELSQKYAKIKPVDKKRLPDNELANLFNEAKTANQMTMYYLYYHHMRRRPASASPEQHVALAGAVLDKLNYARRSQNQPLALTKTEEGYHLDLSRSSYTVFKINIIDVYRRNVLAALKLTSLDVSHTKLDNFYELRGIRLQELRMAGVKLENPKQLYKQIEPFRLKRLVLDVEDYPKEVIAEVRKNKIEVIDAKRLAAQAKKQAEAKEQSAAKKKNAAPATPARPAGSESPGSTVP